MLINYITIAFIRKLKLYFSIYLVLIMIRVGNVVSNYSGMILLGLMDEKHGPTCNTYQWNHLCLAL